MLSEVSCLDAQEPILQSIRWDLNGNFWKPDEKLNISHSCSLREDTVALL